MPAQVSIRQARPGDRNFILDSMRRTLTRNSAYAEKLPPGVMNLLIEPIAATYSTLVACPKDDQDEILGYLIHDGPSCVGFVYVKEPVRKRGIAKALFARAGIKPSEVTAPLLVTKLPGGASFIRFCDAQGFKVRFRPWAALTVLAAVLNPKVDSEA